jgi:hypothetical protein
VQPGVGTSLPKDHHRRPPSRSRPADPHRSTDERGGVEVRVEYAANGERGCCGVGDHVHDSLIGFQWSTPPVEGDPGEQPVFDPVPLLVPGDSGTPRSPSLWLRTVERARVSTARDGIHRARQDRRDDGDGMAGRFSRRRTTSYPTTRPGLGSGRKNSSVQSSRVSWSIFTRQMYR